ncbi:MAG: hypothetical protein HOY79_33765 [Streptomyces sp.]|nr:hypothetical protein [Streptomyces sp.]NUS11340.1 hypothetical protein [Streptomyces sp.]NUS23385.1 hypothetical protein [Streptomyces sp.]
MQLTPGDQAAVDDFQAHLIRRMPDTDERLDVAERLWCVTHESAMSECTHPPVTGWQAGIVSRPSADPEPGPCRGADGGCGWRGRCTGMEDTCDCGCPVCLGETPQDYGFDGDY